MSSVVCYKFISSVMPDEEAGCSSGIGLAIAVKLAAQGIKTYATMRNVNKKAELIKGA